MQKVLGVVAFGRLTALGSVPVKAVRGRLKSISFSLIGIFGCGRVECDWGARRDLKRRHLGFPGAVLKDRHMHSRQID